MNKDSVIIILGLAAFLFMGLYFNARSEIADLQASGRKIFNMLPSQKQEQLIDEWEARHEIIGEAPPARRY